MPSERKSVVRNAQEGRGKKVVETVRDGLNTAVTLQGRELNWMTTSSSRGAALKTRFLPTARMREGAASGQRARRSPTDKRPGTDSADEKCRPPTSQARSLSRSTTRSACLSWKIVRGEKYCLGMARQIFNKWICIQFFHVNTELSPLFTITNNLLHSCHNTNTGNDTHTKRTDH